MVLVHIGPAYMPQIIEHATTSIRWVIDRQGFFWSI